ncbi:MAG: hypothetical protein Q9186_004644 [Xanthomendoza sp. 1 TL-2023]
MDPHIGPARTDKDRDDIRSLFLAYAESQGIDLSFQHFQTELHSLPGKYAAPDGELLLARDYNGIPLGCVALRPLSQDACCEMKRLYVAPAGRGLGLGTKLATAMIDVAIRLQYREIKLDTLPSMVAARALYTNLGFTPTGPYYDTPLHVTQFLARKI